MKADDTKIREFLEGSKQFIVPLFQRTYSWKMKNVKRVWEDVIEVTNGNKAEHFFGSFVSMPVPSSASKVAKYIIIDGQQRLVTVFLFLTALGNRIKELDPKSDKKDEIYELYLINKYYPEDKYKIVPTEADKKLFFNLIEGEELTEDGDHKIIDAYRFFEDELSQIVDIDKLLALKEAIMLRFPIVDIRLEDRDDPYLIFETINATGTPLTQADLIRNYLFMRIHPERQQDVYEKIWFSMQQNLGDSLEDFIRHYLAKDGNIPAFNRIYSTFKENADKEANNEDDVIEIIKDLKKYAGYYYKFLYPEKENDKILRDFLEKFDILGVSTSYPLLLRLYDDYAVGRLTRDEFSDCLKAIEIYIVRRAVCGISAQALNKYFPTIYKSLNKNDIAESLKKTLQTVTGTREMPDDEEFIKCLRERNLYGNKILRYLLEEIERYDNKEVVDFADLQIEHVMPQTLSDEWKNMLGPNWELIHRKYLGTLGNLTLTGYNPEYSNKPFTEKRDMEKGFKESGLRINRDLAKLNKWTEEEIIKRAENLAGVALKIWSF